MLFLLILGIYGLLIYTVVSSIWSLNLSSGTPAEEIARVADSTSDRILNPGLKVFLTFVFAAPNTTLFVAVFWIFFNCHPTAQFNAGSDAAMNYWSFWVHQYFAFVYLAGFVCAFHFFAFVVACFARNRLVSISVCSFFCSAIVFWVIFVSAPTA